MAVSKDQKEEIEKILRISLDKKLSSYARESSSIPFLSKLIQDNKKVAAYSFIHSIATSLGMSIYEQISVVLAAPSSEEARRNVTITEGMSAEQKKVTNQIMADLRNGTRKVNKEKEIKEILKQPNRNKKKQKEGKIVDFYMRRRGKEYFFEIKTAKPNIDVFTTSKKKLLEWIARKDKKIETILAIPYNPYHPEPYSRFTEQGVLEKGKELLVAEEYWDLVGGKGAYKEIVKIFDKIGKEYKNRVEAKIEEVAKIRYT